MRVFMLAVLPADPAHVPVLAKNMSTKGGEDLPRQYRPSLIPFPKGQGGKVRHSAPSLVPSPLRLPPLGKFA